VRKILSSPLDDLCWVEYLRLPSLGRDLCWGVSGEKIPAGATRLRHNRTRVSKIHLNLGLLPLLQASSIPAYVPALLITRLLLPMALKPGVGVMLSRAFWFSILSLSISVTSKLNVPISA